MVYDPRDSRGWKNPEAVIGKCSMCGGVVVAGVVGNHCGNRNMHEPRCLDCGSSVMPVIKMDERRSGYILPRAEG